MSGEKFIIMGGKPLRGEIEVKGAKNAAFPILAACLLTDKECIIENLPLIEDVFRMVEILKSVGTEIDWVEKRTLKVRAKNIDPSKIREDLITVFRGSVLLIGPLLAMFKKLNFVQPGGCIIGARPITTHLDGFSQLGVEIIHERKPIKGQCQSLDHFKFRYEQTQSDQTAILNEFSVTATENLTLFSSLNPGRTTIKIADADYEIQELCRFLKKMGVKIKGAGTHTLEIEGQKKLKGVRHKLMTDPIEAGTFIIATACTKGQVVIKNIEFSFLEFPLKKLKDFGVPLEILGKKIKVLPWEKLKIDKIQSLPYPGIPTDLQSAFGVLATQAEGPTLIHDPLYEGRLKYLEELNKMGAEIYFADPHRAIINGPTQLYGKELNTFDLRGGAALIIAGLIAKGQTIINNIYQIDRGYEKIDERLQRLGADIKRIKE